MSLSAGGGPSGLRREKKAQRERDAELDNLTVRARLATVGARKLTSEVLDQVYDRLIDQALHEDGHVRRQAIQLVLQLAAAAIEDEDDTDPSTIESYKDMTPAQRATYRAGLDKRIMELGREADAAADESTRAGAS